MNLYLVIKSLHLIAVISWMAGLLYLPRIFVYHVENYKKKEILIFDDKSTDNSLKILKKLNCPSAQYL